MEKELGQEAMEEIVKQPTRGDFEIYWEFLIFWMDLLHFDCRAVLTRKFSSNALVCLSVCLSPLLPLSSSLVFSHLI